LAFGCPHIIAVSAWLAEQAAGTVARASLPESVQDLSDRFAVPVLKRGRLLVVEDAWVAALGKALER
jgi:pyridoxal biosynthesis lyase PdxS